MNIFFIFVKILNLEKNIYIYPVDEMSMDWLIVNELISDKDKNKFIITSKCDVTKGMNYYIRTYDCNGIGVIHFSNNKILKASRKIKLRSLSNNDDISIEIKIKLNELRFNKIIDTIKKYQGILERNNFTYHRKRITTNNKISKKQKRIKLARKNRSKNKAQNR